MTDADSSRRMAKAGRHPTRPPVTQKRRGRAGSGAPEGRVFLYGLHTVEVALANPRRVIHAIYVTRNALARLQERGVALPVKQK